MGSRLLRPPAVSDADVLFPLVFQTDVVDTLRWDGPTSREAFAVDWARISAEASAGQRYFFVMEHPELEQPIGCSDIRPDAEQARAEVGLWIGKPFHGRGLGTRTVGELVEFGLRDLGLSRIEAHVFVGNIASRRIFEKNGFLLEDTVRGRVQKRGRAIDEWLFALAAAAR